MSHPSPVARPPLARLDLSMEALAARILARHSETVRVKKAHVATMRLARIMESTLALANRVGFHSMSLRDLSTESGLSMGALYAYFDSKETLLLMILGTVSEVVEEALGEPPADLPPPERLRWLLAGHVALTEAMLPWFTFAYMQAKSFPREARDMAVASEQRTEGLIAAILADGNATGDFRVADVEMAAALIKPMLQDWYVKRSKYRRRKVSAAAFTDALMGFAMAALGARASVPA
ncbi:TetR/AcrR family transcriptional regulator [Aquabacter cavernae]|uniref:TetR/AcrR family transcriptional regulator n=1 Tax=Aquabacter cavernae TaxID=2496029 RepID=UPI00196B5869|nr:TetR/AcrR family transcriptional regulator [Aquabacter cavernae]